MYNISVKAKPLHSACEQEAGIKGKICETSRETGAQMRWRKSWNLSVWSEITRFKS